MSQAARYVTLLWWAGEWICRLAATTRVILCGWLLLPYVNQINTFLIAVRCRQYMP